MKSDAIAYGIAGIFFGLIAGWIIGTQQAKTEAPAPPVTQESNAPAAPTLDEAQVTAYKTMAEREASNPVPRVQLARLYRDAERFDEAIKWYSEALKLTPKDVDVSTDLGLSYYYANQPDRALDQFKQSLSVDPRHAKTVLYVGVVKAWGKQDLEGAQVAWQQVIDLAPDSAEGRQAREFLDRLKASHPPSSDQPSGS
jgi:cytochrome c-type biogenesis protein CcmH/NrfG